MELYCLFLFMNPFAYKYLHVLPWSHANPSFGALNCLGHHWCDETPYLDAWSHSLWKGEYLKHLMQPHTIMMWHGQWVESHAFFYLVNDFLHHIIHLGKGSFCGGIWNQRLVLPLLSLNIGGSIIQCQELTHVDNPWFFTIIFIGLIIIKLIVRKM